MAKMNVSTRIKAVELLLKKMSQRQVASELGISRGAVRGIREKMRSVKNVADRKRSGRPPKIRHQGQMEVNKDLKDKPKIDHPPGAE